MGATHDLPAQPARGRRSGAVLAAWAAFALAVGCGAPERAEISPGELAERDLRLALAQLSLRREARELLIDRLERDVAAGREPRLDLLFLSGGGAWGAFGAGFLRAWRAEVPAGHECAFPDFDVVSGISTGALLAPFAAIGTPDRLRQADELYRRCSPDWVKVSTWSLLRREPGVADTSGLDEVLRSTMNLELAEELHALQLGERRQVTVGSTDLDLARPVTWRLGDEAGRALDAGDAEYLFRPLRASASIPGAFSPVLVDGALHVDGAVFGQVHVMSDPRGVEELLAGWRKLRPEAPMPVLRFWVVVNNVTRLRRETVQPTWSSVLLRSNSALYKEQVTGPLNQLALLTRLMRVEFGLDAQMRWIAVPREFDVPETESEFDPALTAALSDLGARMGADPGIWKAEGDLGLVELERAALGE